MRKTKNWLQTFADYVEQTESPKNFWFWSGISTIASAVQRKVWLPFGLSTIYPNLYVMLVADPGKCRKGLPVDLSKRLLSEISVPIFADSPTKRNFTRDLNDISKTNTFVLNGATKPMSAMSVLSKEMSSFLSYDPKAMIEVLTDLYDCHDNWEYKTSEKGWDKLVNICINCLIATTPKWLANNLPEEAIGGGFTSRFAIVYANEKYAWIPRPPIPPREDWKLLVHDLGEISRTIGEFRWDPDAGEAFDTWYSGLAEKIPKVQDERLHPYLERIHAMVMKTSMVLQLAESNDLVITRDNINRSIILLEDVLDSASDAFAGKGKARTAPEMYTVTTQLATLKRVSFVELMRLNFRNLTKVDLEGILDTLRSMALIEIEWDAEGKKKEIIWKGKEKKR